jgi:hypothetical protein
MRAEGVNFDVLRNLLFKWFPEDLNRNPKFGRFDQMDESKIPFPEREKQDFNCDCCEKSYSYKQYGCSKALGRWCAYMNMVDSIVDDISRLVHFYDIHKKLEDDGHDVSLNKDCINILRKYIKIEKAPKLEGLTFYTIVPKERLPYNDDQINKLRLFCEKRFVAKNFERCKWVIESGKHEENPNLHIHCIGRLKNKNFKREFITQWNKIYDNEYNISYSENDNRGWDKIPCNTAQIQEDKLNYLINSLKGNHENFIDLKIGGTFGW